MKILGITGTSGSGKTTLSKILNEKDYIEVIDADKVAKEMSVPGTEYLEAIRNVFGTEIILEDGNLNRKLLASKIYNNEKARNSLNSLTFEFVLKEIKKRVEQIDKEKIDIAVIDAPLLLEAEMDSYCDYVVVLIADRELKIERICQRDKIDYETAEKRLNIQQEDDYYINKADFVIYNRRNCNLKQEIDNILEKIENI